MGHKSAQDLMDYLINQTDLISSISIDDLHEIEKKFLFSRAALMQYESSENMSEDLVPLYKIQILHSFTILQALVQYEMFLVEDNRFGLEAEDFMADCVFIEHEIRIQDPEQKDLPVEEFDPEADYESAIDRELYEAMIKGDLVKKEKAEREQVDITTIELEREELAR